MLGGLGRLDDLTTDTCGFWSSRARAGLHFYGRDFWSIIVSIGRASREFIVLAVYQSVDAYCSYNGHDTFTTVLLRIENS